MVDVPGATPDSWLNEQYARRLTDAGQRGVVLSAANIDKSWIGEDADAIFTEALGREVHVVNDADAAGLAESEYGAAKGRKGLVMVITLGTGIGSAMIWNGALVPNSEMGHLELDGVAVPRPVTPWSSRPELA